ncbi:MAG: T9SS type A sorting domain-containing protein [Bacteroidota bacterium]
MKNWIIALLAALIGSPAIFAQNLVVNPSFEDYAQTYCGIIEQPSVFSDIATNWTTGNRASPDLYFTNNAQECYNHQPNSSYPGPITFKGIETPSEGTAMAGIWVYTIDGFNQREYIQGSLSSPLQVGQQYRFSVRLSLGDNMEFSVEELQVLFSQMPISQGSDGLINNVSDPQVSFGQGINTSDGWLTYEVLFEADEAYEYFTIGNFKNDEQTEVIINPTADPNGIGTYGAYYFVDEVVVEEATMTSTTKIEEEQLVIAPNPASSVLNLRLEASQEKEVSYQLINIQGQIVASGDLGIFTGQQELDISYLANGMYFIQIESGNQLITRKFSVQR